MPETDVDGHHRGARVIARSLRDASFGATCPWLRREPDEALIQVGGCLEADRKR